MQLRCPTAQAIGVTAVRGWRFVITRDGFASIVPEPGGIVHGVLWRLGPRDLAAINAYESLDSGLYIRRTLPVRHCGRTMPALTYVVRAAWRGPPTGRLHDGGRGGSARLGLAGALRRIVAPLGTSSAWRALEGHGRTRMSGQRSVNQDTAIRHVLIRGRVQGVGYRAWTERTACERGLGGWVRNRRDGAVEAVFMGETAAVDAMLAACRAGPAGRQGRSHRAGGRGARIARSVQAERALLGSCRRFERVPE